MEHVVIAEFRMCTHGRSRHHWQQQLHVALYYAGVQTTKVRMTGRGLLFEHDVSVPAPPSPKKEVVVDVNNNTDETTTTSNMEQVGN